MSEHTPGEWYHVGGTDKRKAPYIRVSGDSLPGTMAVAMVCERGISTEQAANASLISAAPMLLEALQGVAQLRASIRTWAISNAIPGWQNEDALFAACEAAIKKATGEA